MAPRSEESAWVPQTDDAALDIQVDKPIVQADPSDVPANEEEHPQQEQGPITVDPFVSGTANFCSNLFGTLLGQTKICEHCAQKLFHSEARIKEKVGDKTIYFHPECKSARAAIEEKKAALHEDLLNFFAIKEEMALRSEEEHNAAMVAKDDARALEANDAEQAIPQVAPTRKRGFFAKLFGGCRSEEAVA